MKGKMNSSRKGGDSMVETTDIKIRIDVRLHKLMKELSKRKREYISLTYEKAITAYLNQVDNYMGEDIAEIVTNIINERKGKD